ncbi:MAG: 50S ribosomal protein L3 [bacterium]
MKGLIGKKVGMTQFFQPDGNVVPVTVVHVQGNVVVQKKSESGKDGYSAVKLGYGAVHQHVKEGTEPKWRLTRPQVGVFAKAGIAEPRKHVQEIRVREKDLADFEVGQELGPDLFKVGEFVDAVGTTKGRGFTGVMKRHNFAGMKASHGVHEFYRHGGSIGSSAWPSRVFAGTKMAGQYGNERVTVQNLKIVGILEEDGCILVRGGIPGPNGGIVTIKAATKKQHN